jgi:glutaminyl-tRNA synthetase
MAVLRPLKVILTNVKTPLLDVPHFPFDPTRGSHKLPMGDVVYIDRSDFRLVDDEDFFGLAPGKMVFLRYAQRIICESHEVDASGEVVLLRCRCLPEEELPEEKPKGMIQFVPEASAVSIEARVYNPLFAVEEPGDEEWEQQLNPESEIVYKEALVDQSIFLWNPTPETHLQFERIGFFNVDKDSNVPTGVAAASKALASGLSSDETALSSAVSAWQGSSLVLNLTVNLKDSKPKVAGGSGAGRSRKEEQAKQLADKLVSSALIL